MPTPNTDSKGNPKFCCFKSTKCNSTQVVGRKKGSKKKQSAVEMREIENKPTAAEIRESESMAEEDVIAGEVRFEENFSKMLREAEKRESIRLSKISLKAKRDNRAVLSQLIPAVLKRREDASMMLEDKIATEIRFEENFAKMLEEAEQRDSQKRERMKKKIVYKPTADDSDPFQL